MNDIYQKAAWFLDVQKKEIDAENFRQQKIEMAKFMCESLSAGLATPLTFAEIEHRLESFDIASMKAVEVITSSAYDDLHALLLKKDAISSKLGRVYTQNLLDRIEYWDGDKYVNTPTRNRRYLKSAAMKK